MGPAARTPEELEQLLEDAFVIRDRGALVPLFEERALLVSNGGAGRVRGSVEIAESACLLWERGLTYLGDPRRVLQARDLALVLGDLGTNVARRGADGDWRYAISLLALEGNQPKEQR